MSTNNFVFNIKNIGGSDATGKTEEKTDIFTPVGNETNEISDYFNFVNKETKTEKIFQKNKVTYQTLIKVAADLFKTEPEKRSTVVGYINELKTLDEEMNKNIISIMDFLGRKGKNTRKVLKKTSLQLYILQVKALKELLKGYQASGFDLQKQLDKLIEDATSKVEIVNKILDSKDSIDEGGENIITNEIVEQKRDVILEFIRNNFGTEFESELRDFMANQRGGFSLEQFAGKDDAIPQFQLLKTKINAIFAFLKSEIPLKIVFLSNYLPATKESKEGIKFTSYPPAQALIMTFLTNMFVEYKPTEALKNALTSSWSNIAPKGKDGEPTPIEEELKRFGDVTSKITNFKTPNPIFIPTFLSMINGISKTKFAELFQENSDNENTLTVVIQKLLTSLKSIKDIYNSDGLLDADFIAFINKQYKEFVNKNKVTYSYVTTRVDNEEQNPRFDLKRVEDSEYVPADLNFLELEFTQYNKKIEDAGVEIPKDPTALAKFASDNDVPPITRQNFYFGPFDGYFGSGESSKDTAVKIYEDIEKKLILGDPFCIIPVGKSGSGKTSKLIFFSNPETGKGEDGIIIEVLKQKMIVDNYDELTLKMRNIYTTFPENPKEGGASRYKVSSIPIKLDGKSENSVAPEKSTSEGTTFQFDSKKTKSWVVKTKLTEAQDKAVDEKFFIGQIIKDAFDGGREIEPTPNNYFSSRSHVVVHISGKPNVKNNDVKVKDFDLIICDLAGAENEFVCEGPANEIQQFMEIYSNTTKLGKDPKGKAARIAEFEEYKCAIKTDEQLQAVLTKFDGQVEKYNEKNTDKIELRPDTKFPKNNGFCTNVPMYQGNDMNEKLGDKDILKPFVFSSIHGFNYKNEKWNSILSGSDSGGEEGESVMEAFSNIFDIKDKKFGKEFITFSKELTTYMQYTIAYKNKSSGGIASYAGYPAKFEDFKTKPKTWRGFSEEKKLENYGEEFNKLKNSLLKGIQVDVENRTYINENLNFGVFFGFILLELNPKSFEENMLPLFTITQLGTEEDYESEDPNYMLSKNIEALKGTVSGKRYEIVKQMIEKLQNKFKMKKSNPDNNPTLNDYNKKSIKYLVPPTEESKASGSQDLKQQLLEQLSLIRLWYSCTLRRLEGEMINTSLGEMEDQIKDLIITSNGLKPSMLYWDTLYHPYCYNLNMLSDSVYTPPAVGDKEETSILIRTIKSLIGNTSLEDEDEEVNKKFGKRKLVFIVFLVLNLSFRADNPPLPPYLSLDLLKYHYANGNEAATKQEIITILTLAKSLDYYSKNPELKKIDVNASNFKKQLDKQLNRYYNKVIDLFEKPNSATLLGTMETTEKLQKLNFNYMCTPTPERVKLGDDLENDLQLPLIKPPTFEEYRKKYDFKIIDSNIDV